MTDIDREYIQALEDMAEQINLRCQADCDICLQLELCAAVRGMRSYIGSTME